MDAILYVLRKGGAWRRLPREFPPWPSVHRWFLRLAHAGVFDRLAHVLTMVDRERTGREASPTAADRRPSCTGVSGDRGFDPARRVAGRKRHVMADTDGRVLVAAISPANLHDTHGGVSLLRASRRPWPFLTRAFADRAYAGERVGQATCVKVAIVGAAPGQKGFAVRPGDGSSSEPSAGSRDAAGSPAAMRHHRSRFSPSSCSPPP